MARLMQEPPPSESAAYPFGLVGDSPEVQRVLRIIGKLANNRCPVLVTGESGTGKELVARALHAVAPGMRGVFVAVNVAALPASLAESELFGHLRGSFTGATAARRGLVELASGGTLFLDEIGEMPLELQPKLLRVLETQEIRPVGAEYAEKIDARVIAATNRDLGRLVEQGKFRADLYYRLNVVALRLPPLRERREDIPLLIRYFLERYAPRPMTMTPLSLRTMMEYDWPGNVRQLENAIRRMVALCSGNELHLGDLPTQIRNAAEALPAEPRLVALPEVAPLADVERLAIEHALKVTRGDRRKAARLLGIGKTTLYRKLKGYGLDTKARDAEVDAEVNDAGL